MTITLNEETIRLIDSYCMEMPTKYGLPIIQILQKLANEQNEQIKKQK